jgi:hypothetical protein
VAFLITLENNFCSMKQCCLILGLLIAYYGIAQVTQRNILTNKFSAEQVKAALVSKDAFKPYPQTAEAWRKALPDSVFKQSIVAGEAGLKFKFEPISATLSLDFVRSGDRERHSNISFAKRNTLTELILAESMEDKGRFTEAILNGIWSICEESFWGVPAHIGKTGLPDVENPEVDLFTAETASVLALADYFTGPKLDKINPLIRKRIYFETNRRLFEPMLTKGNQYKWMSKTMAVNNWNPWIMSNWMLSNLLLEKQAPRRAAMLYASISGLDLYLNGLGEDGGCDEGPSYWFAAGGSVYDCLELLQQATQLQVYDHPLIQKMAAYVYKAHIDGYYFTNFADADPVLKPDGLMLYRFGIAIADKQLESLGAWSFQQFPSTGVTGFQRMRRVQNLLTIPLINKTLNYQPVKDAWVSDIQVMTARTSKGLYLATHGGHNAESHNHNDVGDFIVYANGQPMIVDAGRGNYTARTFSSKRYELWFTQSEYHNLPIINGFGQIAGREFEATQVVSNINEQQAVLTMNIAAAYPKEAGIKQWERKIKLDRVNNQIALTDSYALAVKASSIQQVFMTVANVNLSNPGSIILTGDENTQLQLDYDAKLWTASSELTSTEGMEYKSFKTKWGGKLVTRILLTAKTLKTTGIHSFKISMK